MTTSIKWASFEKSQTQKSLELYKDLYPNASHYNPDKGHHRLSDHARKNLIESFFDNTICGIDKFRYHKMCY